MQVQQLTGALLDYWVAQADGWIPDAALDAPKMQMRKGAATLLAGLHHDADGRVDPYSWSPSTDWRLGGPIIDRESISVFVRRRKEWGAVIGDLGDELDAHIEMFDWRGDTPLIAAMRCYVASKFGETVADSPA